MNRILFITAHSPFESNSGAHQRSNLIFQSLLEIAKVDLFCFNDKKKSDISNKTDKYRILFFDKIEQSKTNRLNVLLSLFGYNSISRKSKRCVQLIQEILNENEYDFIVIRYINNALLCGIKSGKNVIIDVDDLPEQSLVSKINSNSMSFFKRLYYTLRALSAKYYTNKILKNIHHSFFPNQSQAVFQNSSYLPNIPFPFNDFKNNYTNQKVQNHLSQSLSLLFVGILSWGPNIEGIKHFIENVYPKLKKDIPDLELSIVGGGLKESLKKEWGAIPGILIKGFVNDLNAEYVKTDIVVVPIYQGAGTNIKVLEAMSYGKCVVLSRQATKGFESFLVDGENVLIAQDDKEFAQKVLLALSDLELNKRISENSKNIISKNFSYKIFTEYVHDIIK